MAQISSEKRPKLVIGNPGNKTTLKPDKYQKKEPQGNSQPHAATLSTKKSNTHPPHLRDRQPQIDLQLAYLHLLDKAHVQHPEQPLGKANLVREDTVQI